MFDRNDFIDSTVNDQQRIRHLLYAFEIIKRRTNQFGCNRSGEELDDIGQCRIWRMKNDTAEMYTTRIQLRGQPRQGTTAD